MFPRFIHVVACIRTSLLFMAQILLIYNIYHIVFIHSSIDDLPNPGTEPRSPALQADS